MRTISWADRTLKVALTREQVERSPDPSRAGLSVEYERQLAAHYGVEHVWGESERYRRKRTARMDNRDRFGGDLAHASALEAHVQHQHPKTDGSLHSPGKTSGNRKGLDDRHASGRSEKAEEPKPESDVPPDGTFLDPEFAEANRVTLRELEKDGVSDAHESPDEAAGDDDQRRDPH